MILVFGGTTEGRAVCSVLEQSGRDFYYSTKGDAQEIDLVHGHRLMGAMTREMMQAFIQEQEIHLVVDAAHPFAAELHRTIGEVTLALGVPVVRYERRYPALDERIISCQSYAEMAERLLAQPARRLLALTGVNTITHLKPFWSQRETFFRILDRDDSREKAEAAGFPASHIRYFAEGEDQLLFDEIQPDAVATKESGESGFFDEKVAPALEAGVPVYMITRPPLPEHYQTVYGPVGLRKAVEGLVPEFFPLKTGFTTGSTATAATVAALRALLLGDQEATEAEIFLPSGEPVRLPIEGLEATPRGYRARALKYSGDDPDVTHGAEICSEVWLSDEHREVRFVQGPGVGVVTLPGLGIPIGEPAINATPRQMMTSEVRRLYPEGGVDIMISIPEGEALAKKTFNPRLGILGGISVIGTSGVVKPFSSEAFVASIARQTSVALSLGADTIVINSGAKSEGYLRAALSELPPQSFVQYGNFIGETLAKLAEHSVPKIIMGIMLGKAVKLAEGNMDTHSKKVVMNRAFLHEVARSSGCSAEAEGLIDRITLARELWSDLSADDLGRFMRHITRACFEVSQRLVPESELTVLLIDDEGQIRYSYPFDYRYMMREPIYFVSLGPGDPELITLQALRLLERCDRIYTPVALAPSGRRSSKASEIMLSLGIRPEQLQSYDLPMSKQRDGAQAAYRMVADEIIRLSREGSRERIAVVAEGDSGFYSSSAYIGDHLLEAGLQIRQLAGVPAFIASNALVGGQLVQLEEQLRVIPGEASAEEWAEAWQGKHTIVVMKGSLCQEEILRAMALYPERQWHYLEFVGQEGEYCSSDVAEISQRKFPYFSIIISKARRG